jgi:hypothetical protein
MDADEREIRRGEDAYLYTESLGCVRAINRPELVEAMGRARRARRMIQEARAKRHAETSNPCNPSNTP